MQKIALEAERTGELL